MLNAWYTKKQLDSFAERTQVRLHDWQALTTIASVKQILVPSALTFYVGDPVVRQFFAVEDQTLATKHKVLQVAASLARFGEQAVYKSVVQTANEAGVALREIDGDVLEGGGLIGKLDRATYVFGDTACMASENVEIGVTIQTLVQQFELDGKYTLLLAQKQPKRLLAIFACEYELLPGAADAVQALHAQGTEVVLLTSAKTSIAKGIGSRLNLSLIHSELTPTEKQRIAASLVKQQPASIIMGSGIAQFRDVQRILIGGRARDGVLARVPDFQSFTTLMQEGRTLVENTRKSLLWRNL